MIRSQQVEDLFFGETFSSLDSSSVNGNGGNGGNHPNHPPSTPPQQQKQKPAGYQDSSVFDPILHDEESAGQKSQSTSGSGTPKDSSKRRELLVNRPPPMSPVGEIDSQGSGGGGEAFDVFAGLVPHPGLTSQ